MSLQSFVKKKFLKRLIIHHFNSLPPSEFTSEQREIVNYLKSNRLTVFPNTFTQKYKAADVLLEKDPKQDLLYTIYQGKKLYYKDGTSRKKAQRYFRSIFMEQDIDSPHRYLTKDFNVEHNEIVVDVGVAEGNFSLDVVDKVRKLYLFEPDFSWRKALNATFEPWKEKVHLIPKIVSSKTDELSTSLDDFFANKEHFHFLKIDVDGYEKHILQGLKETLQRNERMKIAICTYHRQEDKKAFSEIFNANGFSTSTSKGYMIFRKRIEKPYLRRGVLRAIKEANNG